VSQSSRVRLVPLLITPPLVAGCVVPTGESPASSPPASCGVRAATDPRQPERLREKPPACSVPAAADVALACGVHDHVTSSDYRPPTYDEEGVAMDARPIPTYAVTRLNCRFLSRDRNEAVCRFQLSVAGGGTTNTRATFEHRFVQDHGPAHHWYGTSWFAKDRCAPALLQKDRGS
jgi:hypothetical protein